MSTANTRVRSRRAPEVLRAEAFRPLPRRTDDFFAKPRRWSEWKHRILLKYSRMWAYKLSSKHSELAFIDACAGEGIYADGSEGSPVIAAKWNDDPGLIRNNARLVVHAFEESPDSAARLRQALGPWVERGLATIYESSFEHELPALLARTRGMPTLIFIDPYGIDSLTVNLLQPLLDDRQRRFTEILFRVDPGLFSRMAGWIPKKHRDQKGERTAASFREKL